MKKAIQKWLGITELQDRDKGLGKILIPYHRRTDKMIGSIVANLNDIKHYIKGLKEES